MPEAIPLTTAPPSKRFFIRVRAGALSSASSLNPPSLQVRIEAAMVAKVTALKRPQDSLRTRPRSLLSLMRLMVGFRATFDGSGTALAPLVYREPTTFPLTTPYKRVIPRAHKPSCAPNGAHLRHAEAMKPRGLMITLREDDGGVERKRRGALLPIHLYSILKVCRASRKRPVTKASLMPTRAKLRRDWSRATPTSS